ncbi:strawberry notch-like NTP hydrolase domain-containing protein, partial [Sphingobium yanoikuyae]|uniref:strawberry notch-like NTP hydrolase domain-containing protein n=1 Tax=Sphingobium yanoikuyae TaxID=13690 RepID=UPI0035C6DC93
MEDALAASQITPDAISSVSGKTAPKPAAPSLAETIRNPNDLSEIVARRESEAQRNPNEGNLAAPVDSWADTGRKIAAHVVPGFKSAIGGALQALIEGAAVPDPTKPLTSDEIADMQGRMQQGIATLRERGAMPGQQMHDEARRDLEENAFAPGDSNAKYYAGMFADSMIQMLPVIGASIVTRSPLAGAAITGAQVGGQQYGDSREDGRSSAAAAVDALFMGTAEAVGEKITLGMLMKPGGKFLPRLLKQMVGEGVQEMGTQVLQTGYDMNVLTPDMTWKEAVDQVRDAGIVGALMGGGMATIEAPFHAGEPRARAPQDIDRAAIDALSPSRDMTPAAPAKANVPLTAEDNASPISNEILQAGKNALADAMAEVKAAPPRAPAPRKAAAPAADTFSRMVQITLGSESRNRDHDERGNVLTSPAGAKGKMQVMDGTNRDPGYGVRPAQDDSLAERARVGRDYLAALLREYKGNPAKMWGAYNWGPGNLDSALAKYGEGWLDHAPAETRGYVMKNLSQLGQAGFNPSTGELATVAAPEQAQLETESPMEFAARVLGEDFLSPLVGAESTVPEVTTQTPAAQPEASVSDTPSASLGVASQPDAAAIPEPAQAATQAPANIRGEAIDGEWSRFSDTSGTLNLPRADMPQIDAAHRGAFANFLKGRGISSHDVTIPADNLKPTQAEYSEARVAGAAEREGGNRAILVSNDGYIVDGHHQWMAARDAGEPIRAIMLDAPIADVLRAGHEFPSSFVDDAKDVQTRARRDRSQDTETDLLTFLAANGGISDEQSGTSLGHSLRAGRNLQRFIPGLGSLIRPSGMSIDAARERMVEAGWLPDDATEADALELIEQASFNPVYHPTSDRALKAATREDENLARQQNARELIDMEAARLGLEGLDDTDLDRAAALSLDGYSEIDALYATIERKLVEGFAEYPATIGEEYHVPFDAAGAPGWEAVQDPFPESARSGAGKEGGERSTPVERAEGEGQAAARQSGETESRASVEDTPSGKGVVVRGASEAELEAIKAALPEKASGMVGRDGGVTYSKKHEDAIRSALRTMPEAPTSESVKPDTAGSEGQATPVASDARQGSEQLSAAEAPATGLTVERVEKRKPGKNSSGSARTIVHMSDGREVELVGIHTGPTVRTDPATGVTTDVSNNYSWDAHTLPGAQGTIHIGTGFSEAEALKRLPAAIEAYREKNRREQEEKFAAIDAGFAANRAVMGNFKKGDAVEFDHGSFYRDGSARTFTGIVKGVQSKDQGTILVTSDTGGEYTVAARNLRPRAVESEPVTTPPAIQRRSVDKKNKNPWVRNGERYTFSEDVDYVSAGQTYEVESADSRTAYFRNVETGGGTSLNNWHIEGALKKGTMTRAATNTPAEGRTAEGVTNPVTPEAARQFEGNRIFTADRVEAARARLREKLSGTTLNSGIDPEVLMDGMTVAGAYIESGVRRFADVAKALSSDLGQSLTQLRPYLAAWYNGARDLLEGQGEDIADMDGPGAVRAALTMIEQTSDGAPSTPAETSSPSASAEQGTATAAQPGRLESAFIAAFKAGRAFASITEARAFAAQELGIKIDPGSELAKALDEQIESAVVRVARDIAVANEGNPAAAYQQLVRLYEQQPRLGVRTSTSVEQQAYSTPVPLAYVASRLAGISQDTTVYEPSAGNGALLIDARPTYVTANELNPDRVAQLRAFLRGAQVTQNDAAEFRPADQFDAVIANPPFGPVKDDTGATVRFQVDGQYSTNEIDHAIAMKALEAMKDGGRAVLIVGGINKTITDPKARADAYNGKAKREFYFKLYSQYNVADHFTVDGSLYAKQGAGWPVDVIVINGRGKSSLRLPAVSAPRQYASWDALQEVLTNGGNVETAGAVRGQDGNPAGEGSRPVATDVGNSGRERAGRDNGQRGRDTAQQPGAVRAGLDNGQSGSVRVDAGRAGLDQTPVDQQPGSTAGRDQVAAKPNPEVEENERQVAYAPGSRSGGMGTLVPVNMQTAISDALDALAQRRGNIDAYVANRLGYSEAQLEESFGAEQVDAIALAIDNIERGAGFIIGDQTGIGKGRVNAAIIRYAVKTGRNAIFVTEKPNLYADMFRDMEDIGLPAMLGREINAVMTNSGVTVPLGEGRSLKSGSDAKKHDAMLRDLSLKGLKASGVDVLMTTYSQMQTVKGQATARQEVIRRLANGGIVMFDESHNAGGTQNAFKEAGAAPNRAEFARELVKDAQGVFYSSATYAKRPDVMDLYAATDMKLAVDDLEKLGEAISKGGVPMQQVVAAMLARSGQYVRRERSFEGIAYETPQIEVDRQQYNNVASVLAAIQDFSEGYVADAVAKVDQDLRDSAENVAPDGSIGGAGAASTNFTAIMHNVVDQMLLAFAADKAADKAIESIKAGEKPVITLASTLETFIEEYAADAGAVAGDKIDITFADIFRRYLERTRRYTVKKPFAEKGEKGERRRLTDEELGAAGVRAFKDALGLIDEAGLDTLPGSPIDYILSKIEAAGYKTSEITGRSMGVDYRPDGTYLKKRGQDVRSIKGRLATINGFNDGTIDTVILNKSGSTGLSLHASEKFKDQRPRRMIIVQAEGNIDTHMQMLGRVHRTGQIVLPSYDQLVVGVPAARRPAAVLAKKMASLNANTTASRDSALTSSEVLDFMNQYGDEIAARMMQDEPEIHLRLGSPLSSDEYGNLNREEAARKVTGRIPLLPIELQEELYERLEDEYRALIAQKDAAGENALEAKTFDFDAELVDRTEAQAPVPGSSSPFADGVYVERVKVKRVGKPIPGADVVANAAGALEIDTPEGDPAAALAALQRQAEGIDRARLAETMRGAAEYAEKVIKSIKAEDKQKVERDKLAANYKNFQAIRRSFRIGDTVRIKTENGNVYGVVMDVYRAGKAKNPIALGVWRARFAIVDAAREMTVTFSQMQVPGEKEVAGHIAIEKADSIGLFKIIDAFDQMQVDSREERSIVTGNLLAGFDYVDGKGAIINYTASGGQVRQGILLPREFNLAKHQAAKPIPLSTPEMVDAFLREGAGTINGNGKTGQITLQSLPRRNTFILTAAKAKSAGGEFFLNRQLTAIVGDFVSRSNGMVADTTLDRAPDAIRVLMEGGAKFEVPAGADDATKELGRKIAERFKPTPPPAPAVETQSEQTPTSDFADVSQPERSMTQAQRGELEARQQQSMARRGGQEAISDQSGGLFSAERDQDSLFSLTDDAEAALREWGEILPRLNEAVKRLGLVDKVNVVAVDRILNDLHVAGRYNAGIIQIALSSPQDPEYTLDHEAVHALRDLGLFKPSEWSALEKGALRDKRLMDSVRQRYDGLNDERLAEEGVADMFAQWRAGRRSQSGFIRQAFQRLLDFLSAIRRAVRGANLEDQVKDIMRRIEAGEVGGRDPDGPGGGGSRDSRLGDATQRLMASGTVDSIREGVDAWRTKLQDRFLPLLRTQQRIEMQSGKAIDESADAYLAEELMTGRVGAQLERLADEMVNPLFDRMKALGLTVDEVETYLYARHAAERNARISSINEEFAEGTGSGMTDAEAAGILARADAEGKIPALEKAAELVDGILKFAVDTRVEAGLLSQEEADAWRETYQFYVPLRGRGELIPEIDADRPRFGSGINVRGKESKRAFGRKSKAANILAYSIMQAEEAIARAGRNEVAQAFYNLARENPDPDFWTLQRVTRKPVWNEATGTVSYRNDSMIQPEDQPYTISLKIGGQERRVTLNRDNPAAVRLAKAMRNLDAPGIGGPLRIMSAFNRYLSRVNTGWNPEFIISNAMRDIQTATVNLAGIDAQGIISGTLRDYRKALAASFKANVKGDESGEWGRWYREFVDAGGRVYFNHVEDVNEIAKRIEKQVSANATGVDGAKMKAKSIIGGTFKAIDAANTGLENAIRLAA